LGLWGFPEVGRCDVGCRGDNRYAVSVPAAEPGRREAELVLGKYKVGAGLAVSDMGRARDFYEGKLGLGVAIDSPGFVQYRCAEDSLFSIYLSPEHAGKSTATLASWGVEGIERIVEELTERGVVFERYDESGLIDRREGDSHLRGRRQGRLLQGSRRPHPLNRPTAALLSIPR
jgi:catechol 2,3-dioxygenase-like lactoylglutathione lyase family enzyme